jgi:hypothetical protein
VPGRTGFVRPGLGLFGADVGLARSCKTVNADAKLREPMAHDSCSC